MAYYTTASNPTNSYRPTGMFITNCDDNLGTGGTFGYCLDQTHAGEWVDYSIYALVPGQYTVEARVEGIGTNGAFGLSFSNASNGNYASNGPLAIPTTNWGIVSTHMFLTNGLNVMKLSFLANGTNNGVTTGAVGKFNYVSIYPWWTNGEPGPTITNILTNSLSTGTNWSAAAANAAVIQGAVNSLPATGGTVTIPSGTWYVSQAFPNDANPDYKNAVVCITNNNVTIAGTNTNATNTVLIANNRSTTLFVLGYNSIGIPYPCANFCLSNMTLEAQPHEVATNSGAGYTNIYELGQLNLNGSAQGSIAVFYGISTNQCSYNICISNCIFLHGIKSLVPYYFVSNLLVQSCTFIPWDTNCFFTGVTNGPPNNTNTPTQNTTIWQDQVVGMFGNGPFNAVIVDNTYIGNAALTNMSTNNLGPDGFIYFQSEGNVFVARNIISNNALEGVQLSAGPNSVVGNTYDTLILDGSCCALNTYGSIQTGLTGTNAINYSTCFIGNSVNGDWSGEEGTQSTVPFTINFSGNSLTLPPPFNVGGAGAGGIGLIVSYCQAANICGNTLVSGGYGLAFNNTNGAALVLNNNFSNAAYRGIGFAYSSADSFNTAQIFGNSLGEGVSFHVQLPYASSFAWFLDRNTYYDTNSNIVPAFLDPLSSAVHMGN